MTGPLVARDPLRTPRDDKPFHGYSMRRGTLMGAAYAVGFALPLGAYMGTDENIGGIGPGIALALIVGLPIGLVLGFLFGVVTGIVVDGVRTAPAAAAAWTVRVLVVLVAISFFAFFRDAPSWDDLLNYFVTVPVLLTWIEAGRHARRVAAYKESPPHRPDRRIPVV